MIREALESGIAAIERACELFDVSQWDGVGEAESLMRAALRELDAVKPDAIRTAIAEEREACAKVCELMEAKDDTDWYTASECAVAIRARGHADT